METLTERMIELSQSNIAGLTHNASEKAQKKIWSKQSIFHLQPFWMERNGESRVQIYKEEPKKKDNAVCSLVDERERPHRVLEFLDSDRFYEEFWFYHEHVIEVARFGYAPDKPLIALSRLSKDAKGHEQEFEIKGAGGQSKENYVWKDEVLTTIKIHNEPRLGPQEAFELQLHYDELNQLKSILIVKDSKVIRSLFERSSTKLDAKKLLQIIAQRLSLQVPELLAKVPGKKYCTVLAYDTESTRYLPPLLGAGLESERQDWIAKHGNEARRFLWNPAEYRHYDTPELTWSDSVLLNACMQFNSISSSQQSLKLVRTMLNEVATTLNQQYVWRESLDLADDFVAFATDLEEKDLLSNMKASIPAELRKKLLL